MSYTPYKHQVDAMNLFLSRRKRGGVFSWSFGAGKTLGSLMIAERIGMPVTVIAPKTLRGDWVDTARTVGVNIDFYNDHYSKIPNKLINQFLIVDEAHRMSGESKRAKKVVELSMQAKAVLCLTGSPIRHGDPVSMYNILRIIGLSGEEFESRTWFDIVYKRNRYDIAKFNKKYSEYLYFFDKKNLNLPPKTRKRVILNTPSWYKGEARKIFGNGLSKYQKFRQLDSLSKVPSIMKFIKGDEQLVVFTSYMKTVKAVTELMRRKGIAVGSISGQTKDREVEKNKFIDGEYQVIVLTYGVAGFGLTFTNCNEAVMLDLPMTVEPNDIINAEDRLHRIGQKNPVTIYWPTLICSPIDRLYQRMISQKDELNNLVVPKSDQLRFSLIKAVENY